MPKHVAKSALMNYYEYNKMSKTFLLTQELISKISITPEDAGCQSVIAQRLSAAGFQIEHLRFANVDNLWARYGTENPVFVFAGHTDVVPPGALENWHSDPFTPTVEGDFLYGRGTADMKSGLAAMVVAAEEFVQHPFKGSLAFLITSDEEGPTNLHGTQKVLETLISRGIKLDYCVIGEATSDEFLGDQLRVGRRGSLSGRLMIYGKQGHVAYPHLGKNPIHLAAPAITELTSIQWDEGNEFFPPTSFQISNIHSGTGAGNVIPGVLEISFNFRFSTASTASDLQQRVIKILENNKLEFNLEWNVSGQPFLTKKAKLITATQEAINELTQLDPLLSTAGGTSDGRFIAPTGAEVIELGPCNSSVHQANEHVRISDLDKLKNIYLRILEKIFL